MKYTERFCKQLLLVIILLIVCLVVMKDKENTRERYEQNLIQECQKELKRTETCKIEIRAVKDLGE